MSQTTVKIMGISPDLNLNTLHRNSTIFIDDLPLYILLLVTLKLKRTESSLIGRALKTL